MTTLEELRLTPRVNKYKKEYMKIVSYYVRNYMEIPSKKNCPATIQPMILKLAYYIDLYYKCMASSMRVDVYVHREYYSRQNLDQFDQIEQENLSIMREVKQSLNKITYWPAHFIENDINIPFMDFLKLISNNTENIELTIYIVWVWLMIEKSYAEKKSILVLYKIHRQLFKILHTKWRYNCEIAQSIWTVFACMMQKNDDVTEILLSTGILGVLRQQSIKIMGMNSTQIYSINMIQLIQTLSWNLYQLSCLEDEDLYNFVNTHRILQIWKMLFTKSQQIGVKIENKSMRINKIIRNNMINIINILRNLHKDTNHITELYLFLNDPRNSISNPAKPLISDIIPYLSDQSANIRKCIINILISISAYQSITAVSLIRICVVDCDLISIIINKFKENNFDIFESINYITILANICSIKVLTNILNNNILIQFLIDILINYDRYSKDISFKFEALRAINNLMDLNNQNINYKLLSNNNNELIFEVIKDLKQLQQNNDNIIDESLREKFIAYLDTIAGIVDYVRQTENKYFKQSIRKIFERNKIGQILQNLHLIDSKKQVDKEYMYNFELTEYEDKIEYFCHFPCMFVLTLQDLVP